MQKKKNALHSLKPLGREKKLAKNELLKDDDPPSHFIFKLSGALLKNILLEVLLHTWLCWKGKARRAPGHLFRNLPPWISQFSLHADQF
ncbi:hypothetical protein R3I94_008904 [Phoxinus phoxinus]|uniref:Uncharacterized protein n=1 Tax=Phoxinus phoxinus TaxID=58324 RepID=A0AAN9GWS4_9TELE